jgi:hypothetical protein
MVARKLAVRLYWMLKTNQPYTPARMQGSPSHPVSTREGRSIVGMGTLPPRAIWEFEPGIMIAAPRSIA